MAVEVEDLIVQPFRELINRGNEAITNAKAAGPVNPELSQVMLKAARALVREGERALNRVEPLILGHLERHGDAFRDAVRECDDIFESHRQLEEVLYDIDDYVDVETFDAVKFAQLQAASKAFALGTIENIRRLRIGEIPVSPTSFPPLPPLPRKRPSRLEPLIISRPGTRTGHYGMDQLMYSPQARSAPQTGHSQLARVMSTSLRSSPSDAHMIRRMSTKKSQKSLAPSTSSSDSHYSQTSFQWSTPAETDSRGFHSQQPSDVEMLGDEIQNLLSEPNSPKFPENRSTLPAASTPWTSAWVHDQLSSPREIAQSQTIPENVPVGRSSEDSRGSQQEKRYTVESDTLADIVFPPFSQPPRPQRASMFSGSLVHMTHSKHPSEISTASMRGVSLAPPIYESLGRQSIDTQAATLERHSTDTQAPSLERHSMDTHAPALVSSGLVNEPPIYKLSSNDIAAPIPPSYEISKPRSSPMEQKTVPKPFKPKAKARIEAHENPKPVWYSREENCSIGPESTLFQFKSFCEGSLAFRNGRSQEATKTAVFVDTGAHAATSTQFHDSMSGAALALGASQPMSFGARKTVTQCITCEYSQPIADFRRDMAKDRRANSTQEGVNFRMRFLYKSHLAAESRTSVLYGCIFCAHLGYTSREGDATVFTSERQLFRHLSHHPQPLPEVPGLTVLYGYLGSNCAEAEDYDLHFPSPQFASPIIPEAPLLTKRPTAVALQPQLQKEGSKHLTDPDGKRDCLQFLVGARIVGVEFPDSWGGKWCTGWHDGVRGAFPAKLVAVEAPPKSDVRLPGTNNDGVIVTSRWKWEPKDVAEGWLVFDKNTTIINVSWLSYDSWCWSGMTKDGKVGFFPSSHIKADSIRDPSGAHGSSLMKKESRRLFKMRHAKSGSSSSSNY